jgi:hypothetical protein
MNFRELAESLDPFMDPEGDTYLRIQVDDRSEVQEILVDSPMAIAVVKTLLCSILKKGYPTDHETRTALDVIRGVAFQSSRRMADPKADPDFLRQPLARAVISIARKGGVTKELPALLAHLNKAALREGIDTKKGRWPATVDALGKQLSQLVQSLADEGVALLRNENDRPRTWTIRPIGSLCQSGSSCDGEKILNGQSVHRISLLSPDHGAEREQLVKPAPELPPFQQVPRQAPVGSDLRDPQVTATTGSIPPGYGDADTSGQAEDAGMTDDELNRCLEGVLS